MAKEDLKNQDAQMCNRVCLKGPRKVSYDFRDIAFTPYGECGADDSLKLHSYVKSVHIELSIADFARHLGLSCDGPCIFWTPKSTIFRDFINHEEAYSSILKQYDPQAATVEEEIANLMNSLAEAASTPVVLSEKVFKSRLHDLQDCFWVFSNLDSFFDIAIEDHLDPNRPKPERKDLIDVVLQLERKRFIRICITKEHIKGVLKDVFLGALDTSAITMTWTMTEHARHLKVLNKVEDEIRCCMGNKGKVEESDIENLPYFRAAVKESWRLHPPVPILIDRETMVECKLEGYHIPNKMRLLVNIFAVNRDPRYWKKPEEFDPETFMENPLDVKGHSFKFLPFGSGRRICPGMNMGIANVELSLANLLYSFDWKLPKGTTIADINIDELFHFTLNKKIPLMLVPIPYYWQKA
ncbi:cytochrome P450 71B19-like [Telopea speciosissima]|uniref:cytochrome P450 71B19-like n=1 Tax=Telopea speciosissima TaxID=54955 RepID=UPI001CC38DD3|nr:cytochrome P450 71B19-like [Telopea speciosissima]